MTTITEACSNIEKIATYPINGLLVIVKINNAKVSYGKIRYNISPYKGGGNIWVDETSLKGIVSENGS